MKLVNNGVNQHTEIEFQVSLLDVEKSVRARCVPARDDERILRSTLALSAHSGALADNVREAMYGQGDLSPEEVFLESVEILRSLADLAIALGYPLDDLGIAILRGGK